MAIIEYIGPFGKRGQLIWETKANCICDYCDREFAAWTQRGTADGSKCPVCCRDGRPLTKENALREYPEVTRIIKTTGNRNAVTNQSTVLVCCSVCQDEFEARFDSVKESEERAGRKWTCFDCARLLLTNEIVYPEDVPELVEVNVDTLGNCGQLMTKTKIIISCLGCERPFSTDWGIYQRTKKCHGCISIDKSPAAEEVEDRYGVVVLTHKQGKVRLKDKLRAKCEGNGCQAQVNTNFAAYLDALNDFGNYKCSSCRLVDSWNRPDSSFITKSSGLTTYMSSPHRRIKELLVEHTIKGFESEQWIGRKRVDELNRDLSLVILVQGTYWHADPRIYDGNNLMYDGLTAQGIWDRDRQYIEDLEHLGYSVLEVWEDDINSDPYGVIDDIKQWIDETI